MRVEPTSVAGAPGRHQRLARAALLGVLLTACGREEILHGLEELQANEVLVALDEGGVRAEKRRDEGSEGTWRVEVVPSDAPRAQRWLAERELPRRRPPGFGEVFGRGSVVPSASEERALYLHALAGELARSVEAIDGVVEARVHLALPPQDPLRADPPSPARGAVLVKTLPGARARLEALAPGIQSLVAGAVIGIEPSTVAVVIAEASPSPAAPPLRTGGWRRALWALAATVAFLAAIVPALLVSGRLDLASLRARLARP